MEAMAGKKGAGLNDGWRSEGSREHLQPACVTVLQIEPFLGF